MGDKADYRPGNKKTPPLQIKTGKAGGQYREEMSHRLVDRDTEQREEGALKALNYRVFFKNSYSVRIRPGKMFNKTT